MVVDKITLCAVTVIAVFLIVCITAMFIASHPYVIRFEMDNNTLEAMKSINWSVLE